MGVFASVDAEISSLEGLWGPTQGLMFGGGPNDDNPSSDPAVNAAQAQSTACLNNEGVAVSNVLQVFGLADEATGLPGYSHSPTRVIQLARAYGDCIGFYSNALDQARLAARQQLVAQHQVQVNQVEADMNRLVDQLSGYYRIAYPGAPLPPPPAAGTPAPTTVPPVPTLMTLLTATHGGPTINGGCPSGAFQVIGSSLNLGTGSCDASFSLPVDGGYTGLSAAVALGPSSGSGSISFEGDGRTLPITSAGTIVDAVTATTGGVPVSVDLTGVQVLTIVLHDNGSSAASVLLSGSRLSRG
jgi:hypothetical protein